MASSLIRSVDEFETLRQEWDAIAEGYACPLFDHDWFGAAATCLHAADDLRVHVIRHNGRLVAAAPLAVDRSRGRRLTLIGSGVLYEPSGLVFASDDAGSELARDCSSGGDCVVLQRVQATLVTLVSSALKSRALVVRRPHPASNRIDTAGNWTQFLGGLTSQFRKSLRNLRSRAERDVGPWSFSVYHPEPQGVSPLLDEFVRVEDSGWKGREGSSIAKRADLRAFFNEYGRRAASRGRLRIAKLCFGAHIAAMELAVEAHGRWWSLKIGYDEKFAALSPAVQMTHACIQTAFERRLRSYEFLGVAESWQERWRPERRAYDMLAIYPFSVNGVAALAQDAWRSMVTKERTRGR